MTLLTYSEIPDNEINSNGLRAELECDEYIDEIEKRKNSQSVHQSLSALYLLIETMKRLEISLNGFKLIRGKNGRPFFSGAESIDFSLSHSGRFVACAVMMGCMPRVGVDIEAISKNDNYERLSERFFSDGERLYVSEQGSEGFTKIWTMKEALIKYSAESNKPLLEFDTVNRSDVRFDSYRIGDYMLTLCRADRLNEKLTVTEINLNNIC